MIACGIDVVAIHPLVEDWLTVLLQSLYSGRYIQHLLYLNRVTTE